MRAVESVEKRTARRRLSHFPDFIGDVNMELSEIISVRFPKVVVDALRARHAAEGVLPSEQIRRAVTASLKPAAPKAEGSKQ